MNSLLPDRVTSAELEQTLAWLLNPQFRAAARIVRLGRRPSAYSSSYPLEELEIEFSDGARSDLIFKDLSPRHLNGAARSKPDFLPVPKREIEVYRTVLADQRLGTATYYGSLIDKVRQRYWLFLERIDGQELYQVGDFDVWKAAARWLATFHHHFRPRSGDRSLAGLPLIDCNGQYFTRWFERARQFCSDRLLRELAPHYPSLVAELLSLPKSLLHGEFYASNILTQCRDESMRICPVDWELAAVGPSLLDLAALTAGNWSESERTALANHYYRAGADVEDRPLSPQAFTRGLQLCRLHLAVQWLGWSRDWSPPAAHRQNWLAEAEQMARLVIR